MAIAPSAKALADALRYGPQVQQSARKSERLSAAIEALQASSQQPMRGGWGELGSKLLATAILNRANDKAQDATLGAIKSSQDEENTSLLAALGRGPGAPQQPPAMAQAPPVQAPPPAAVAPPPLPVAQAPLPAAQPSPAGYSPEDRDAFIRMLVTEAGGEPEDGIAAAGHVALNRLKTGYGGSKSLRDVVFAKNQFEGMSRAGQVKPDDYERIAPIADAILTGQLQDPTGGAVNFLNPDLQVQLGRNIPQWAQGQGQRIGRHVFFGGQPQQVAQNVPPPPPPPDPNGLPVQDVSMLAMGAQPFETPSAPGSSPPASGAPAAAPEPQAGAAAGMPAWPTYQPTEAELDYVEELLLNPRTREAGVVAARDLRKKMTQAAEASIEMINGVPFYVSKTPGQGGQPVMIPVPEAARTQVMSAQQAGLASAPAGLNVMRDPLGNLKEAPGAPPQGYNATPQGYAPIQGGPADPRREQPAPQGYQYQGAAQAPIPGGPADLKNPSNVMEGANRYGGMVKTIVDSAMKVKQNYGAVVTGFRQQNGPGDIAMTNGIQKLIDDGVVKGEDVNMQMRANGLQGTLGSWQQYAQSGGVFTPEIRNMIYKTATDLYKNLDQTYRVRVQSLAPGFDEAYGQGAFGKYVFPEAFSAELGWTGQPAAGPTVEQPRSRQVSAAQRRVIETMQATGKWDAKAPLGSPKNPFRPADDAEVKGFDQPQYRGKTILLPDGALAVID